MSAIETKSQPQIQSSPEIRVLKSIEDARSLIGTYARTTWRSNNPPFKHLVVQINQLSEKPTGGKFYLKVKIFPANCDYEIPLDYPLIPLEEEEAIKTIDSIRQALLSLKTKPKDMKIESKIQPLHADRKEVMINSDKKVELQIVPAKEVKEKEEVKLPSAAAIIRSHLKEGKSKDEAFEAAKALFPDRDLIKLKQMTHAISSQLKREEKKDSEKA